jgi:hypothetical protein
MQELIIIGKSGKKYSFEMYALDMADTKVFSGEKNFYAITKEIANSIDSFHQILFAGELLKPNLTNAINKDILEKGKPTHISYYEVSSNENIQEVTADIQDYKKCFANTK